MLVAALALGVAASTAVYQVDQGQQAVVLRLGRPVAVVDAPGLHLKWPLAERVARLDGGPQTLQADPRAMPSADGAEVSVGGQMRYRIVDPLRFYTTAGGTEDADARLQPLLAAALSEALGHARADDIVADRDAPALDAALLAMRRRTASLGIAVDEVGVRTAELSTADTQAVYVRMAAEAARQAAAIRADGARRREAVLADADRAAGAIRGDGEGEVLRIRGQGDARRMAVLGAAYAKDPAFARYFRQLEAYENTLTQGDATLLLTPDNAFLRDFARGPGT